MIQSSVSFVYLEIFNVCNIILLFHTSPPLQYPQEVSRWHQITLRRMKTKHHNQPYLAMHRWSFRKGAQHGDGGGRWSWPAPMQQDVFLGTTSVHLPMPASRSSSWTPHSTVEDAAAGEVLEPLLQVNEGIELFTECNAYIVRIIHSENQPCKTNHDTQSRTHNGHTQMQPHAHTHTHLKLNNFHLAAWHADHDAEDAQLHAAGARPQRGARQLKAPEWFKMKQEHSD